MRDQIAASFGKPNPATPRSRADGAHPGCAGASRDVDGKGRRAGVRRGNVRGPDYRPAPGHGARSPRRSRWSCPIRRRCRRSAPSPSTAANMPRRRHLTVVPIAEFGPFRDARPAPGLRRGGRRLRCARLSRPRRRYGQVHVGIEQLGNRTILFGILGERAQPRSSRSGTSAMSSRSERAHLEAFAVLLELDPRRRLQPSVGDAFLRQRERQRHGEAAGMGRGDQLFGVGAALVAEARFEAVGLVVKHARLRR